MEIKVKKEVEEIHNIELPYYTKTVAHYYKVISEDLCLKIYDGGVNNCGIEVAPYFVNMAIIAQPSTEDEFNAAYFNIQSTLNQRL